MFSPTCYMIIGCIPVYPNKYPSLKQVHPPPLFPAFSTENETQTCYPTFLCEAFKMWLIRLEIERMLVQASPQVESLCCVTCVIEKDPLSAAQYWYNPGRPVWHDWKIVQLTGMKRVKPNKQSKPMLLSGCFWKGTECGISWQSAPIFA